jgi:hypothetical protein
MKDPAKTTSTSTPYLPWVLLALAVFIMLFVEPVTFYFLFQAPPPPAIPDEEAVLKKLEIYDPVSELDDKSRVVKLRLEKRFVNDETLDEVVKLKYVSELSLANSAVTDAGIRKLRELKRLDSLGITDTQVTDDGLKLLESMPALRYVWVTENLRLTQKGIESLRGAVPGITVYNMK